MFYVEIAIAHKILVSKSLFDVCHLAAIAIYIIFIYIIYIIDVCHLAATAIYIFRVFRGIFDIEFIKKLRGFRLGNKQKWIQHTSKGMFM